MTVSAENGGGLRIALALQVAAKAYLSLVFSALPVVGLFFLASSLSESVRLEQWWEAFLSLTGHNQRFLFGVMPNIVVTLGYWIVGSLFLLLDYTGWLSKYKTQPGKNQPPSRVGVSKAIKVVLFNQLVVGAPLAVLGFELVKWENGSEMHPEELRTVPTMSWFAFSLLFCFTCREVVFYYGHKMLHHRLLYKHFHKQHHEWTAPIALIAVYCHPLEHIVCNILPVSVGPALLKAHPLIVWTWFALINTRTLVTHSGYHLPFGPCSEFHDYHHLVSNQNYGFLGILDALHGTDQNWRKSKSCERNFFLLGFSSTRELLNSKGKTD